ncbi:MAG TPA: autotransporter-associated beta strand repeat-containing protein, partial [Tepidisphaeraceae bacterium]|nr:autotransporter-associated beta strand repeat-containing protein [Tepidisphaeraceae bacterium]
VIGARGLSTSFAGTITDGTNATPSVVNITKVGTGSLTLSNAGNSYTGLTTVQQGRLVLAGGAKSRVLNAGGADVIGGWLILDYSDTGVSVAPQVLSILDAGYDQPTRFSLGQIRTSNASDPARGLGWIDNTSARQLSIAYTYYGDANLDGRVDIRDLAALAGAWQSSGNWAAGDFDYNGFIDIADLSALASNWQAGVTLSLGTSLDQALASVGLGHIPIPEPATLGAVGLGMVMIARRRRAIA